MPDGGLQLQFDVPPEIAGGTYANVLTVCHSPHEFTFDFAASMPVEQTEAPEGAAALIPCRIVARIKVPPTVVFDILRAVNENLGRYEAAFGAIRPPGGGPPDQPAEG